MPKKPQDHLPPAKDPNPDEPFEFEHKGKTYTLAAPSSVLTVGFARANRRRSLDDQLFTLLEALADESALAAIDDMKKKEFVAFQQAFFEHSGVSLGE